MAYVFHFFGGLSLIHLVTYPMTPSPTYESKRALGITLPVAIAYIIWLV